MIFGINYCEEILGKAGCHMILSKRKFTEIEYY